MTTPPSEAASRAFAGAMLLLCPAKIDEVVEHYCSGELLKDMRFPRDLTHPHEDLLRRVVHNLDLLPSGAHRKLAGGRFVAHVTTRDEWPLRNVGLSSFESNEDVLSAVSASCCLTPGGVLYGGVRYCDGGFTEPLPDDTEGLPTVSVSILGGRGVDIAPSEVGREQNKTLVAKIEESRFLRYSWSSANIIALANGGLMSGKRARERFEEGLVDAEKWLGYIGH